MAHRVPGTPAWELAARSINLWTQLLAEGGSLDTNSKALNSEAAELQAVGSLLLGRTAAEAEDLQQRASQLLSNGLQATYLDAAQLKALEPALDVPPCGAGLLLPTDVQVNGRRTAEALLAACEELGKDRRGSRFTACMHEPVVELENQQDGLVVITEQRRVHARKAVILAAGAWSGQLLSHWLHQPAWADAFQPRRGHLLELHRPTGMPAVHHGMMEMAYTKHYSGGTPTSPGHGSENVDITFTATTSKSGTLLVGSSREFSGFEAEASPSIIEAILERAALFLPHLEGLRQLPASSLGVRVGPRPYVAGGVPMIGPVPGVAGLYLAAGHEGSGLTLAPATAELMYQYVTGSHSISTSTAPVCQGAAGDDSWADAFLPAIRLAAVTG